MLFICYPKCSTCQKAKKWLDAQKIEYTERNIVDVNPTCGELKEWYSKSGFPLKKFFNTSGLLYKEMTVSIFDKADLLTPVLSASSTRVRRALFRNSFSLIS